MSFGADILRKDDEEYECLKRQKQEAIKFAEWLGNNRFWANADVEETWYKLLPNSENVDLSKRYSTEELFNLYKEQMK